MARIRSLPRHPQPLDKLQQRFPAALVRPIDTEAVCKGEIPPVASFPHHVFDFPDGARLIVSRDTTRGAAEIEPAWDAHGGPTEDGGPPLRPDYASAGHVPEECVHVSAPSVAAEDEGTDPYYLALRYFWALLGAEVAPAAYRADGTSPEEPPHLYFDADEIMALVQTPGGRRDFIEA